MSEDRRSLTDGLFFIRLLCRLRNINLSRWCRSCEGSRSWNSIWASHICEHVIRALAADNVISLCSQPIVPCDAGDFINQVGWFGTMKDIRRWANRIPNVRRSVAPRTGQREHDAKQRSVHGKTCEKRGVRWNKLDLSWETLRRSDSPRSDSEPNGAGFVAQFKKQVNANRQEVRLIEFELRNLESKREIA